MTDSGGEVARLAAQLTGTLYASGGRFISFYGTQPRHTDLFDTAWHRAYRSLEPILSNIKPDEQDPALRPR